MNKVLFVPKRYTKQWFKNRRNIVIVIITLAFMLGGVTTFFSYHRVANAANVGGSPAITISPTSGAYSNRDDQTPISVDGSNYAANETVNVYWNYTGPNTGTLVVTTTADSTGSFNTTFLRVLAAAGTYIIAAVGQTSGFVATGSFTQYPQLYVRPQAGVSGTQGTVYGNAYVANETVKVYWNYKNIKNRMLMTTATSNSTGSFAVPVTIPGATPGSYTMAGVGQTSNYVASYQYTIYTPTLALAPLSGSAGIGLTVSAYGFIGLETVDVYWNKNPKPLLTASTDGYGYLAPTTITVPTQALPGSYPVKVVGRTSHITVKNSYTVVVPGASLSITSGPVGVQVGVNGQGFAPGETVNVFWNYTGPGTGTQVGSAVAGYSGSITSQFVVPFASNGPYTVAAVGATSNTTVQQTFNLGNGLAASPSSDGPGQTIAVNGTGFQASESVQFYWDTSTGTPITTANAGSAGNVHTTFAISTNLAPGVHTIIGVGVTSGLSFNASETINTNWGDFGYDIGHHRENLQENTLSKNNVANLQLKWTATTATGLKASPVYSNGLVFLPTMDGYLNAYNATTGALQWQFNCKCSFRNYSSALADPVNNMVFFGTVGAADEGIPSPFYAVNAQTGTLEWSVILNWHQVSFPTLALNTIYVGTSHIDHTNSAIYAIDEVSGHVKWQYLANSGFWGAVGVDPNTNTAFTGVGNPGDAIMSLNALTGAVNWQTVVPNYTADDDVGSGITVSNGFVYATGKNGYVYELNESTGAIIWSTLIGSQGIGNISTQALSTAGVLYVGSFDHKLYALSASTGAILWKAKTDADIFSSPAIANGVVYFASFDRKIYAVNANTGKELWSYKMGNSSYCSPVVVNGWLYCGATDGKLYAFSL